MSRLTLSDANVVIRFYYRRYSNPRYEECLQLLNAGGLLCDYVVPEIVFQYLAYIRRRNAKVYAQACGELDLYMNAPREYIRNRIPESGWRKRAYSEFKEDMGILLKSYSCVEIKNRHIFDMALQIAIETGYDWVDCMLIAEHRVSGNDIASVDTDVLSELASSTYKVSSLQVNKLTL